MNAIEEVTRLAALRKYTDGHIPVLSPKAMNKLSDELLRQLWDDVGVYMGLHECLEQKLLEEYYHEICGLCEARHIASQKMDGVLARATARIQSKFKK